MSTYTYVEITETERSEELTAKLLRLWEDSVRASHHFLQDSDIEALKPYVVEGIKAIPILYIAASNGEPVAFMGIAERKIEMLFVSPMHFGCGIGRRMVSSAIKEHHAVLVDANEQNPQAVGFYSHMGFEVYERTETDDQGNPFPILKMRLKE